VALGRPAYPTFLCAVDSEPQSADICFWVLLYVAESAYVSWFPCWWSPVVSACCALGGVSSGAKSTRISSRSLYFKPVVV
jgi:hypothetical protein